MVVCVPTYIPVEVAAGMNWYCRPDGFPREFYRLGAHAIGRHGRNKIWCAISVFLRSSFGTKGANIPAILRGLLRVDGLVSRRGSVASQFTRLNIASNNAFVGDPLPILDINFAQLLCFLAFWAVHVWFIAKGTESIRWLETYAAPFLIAMGLAL